MGDFNMNKNNRNLSDAFNELKASRMDSIKRNNVSPRGIIFKINNKRKSRVKRKGISLVSIFGVIIGIFFVITTMNYSTKIFAATTTARSSAKKEQEAIQIEEEKEVKIETNKEKIAIESILSNNISTSQRKVLVTEEREIEYKVTYKENSTLPKDEQKVIQEGIVGKEIVTAVQIYETTDADEESYKEEKILNNTILEQAQEQIIEIGTSEILSRFNVHIGDTLYTTTAVQLLDAANPNANSLKTIGKNLDVIIIGVEGNYVRVLSDGMAGYVDSNLVVSAYTNPEFVEKCRLEKIFNNLNVEMNVGQPSGFSLDDYKKILSDNSKDVNKIFEQNAEVFYNLEAKYNINGLFVAAIGIHESAWGTSNIALSKKNLFGFGAYDSDPYNSAVSFDTYEDGIDTVAKVLARDYLNKAGTEINGETATGKYYNGTSIGAVNIKYATDTNWGTAVYNILEGLYGKIQQ